MTKPVDPNGPKDTGARSALPAVLRAQATALETHAQALRTLADEAERARRRVRQCDYLVREMRRRLGLCAKAHRRQRLLQQLLEKRLPRVDHVVDCGRAAERRRIAILTGFHRLSELAELADDAAHLPQMVRSVTNWVAVEHAA